MFFDLAAMPESYFAPHPTEDQLVLQLVIEEETEETTLVLAQSLDIELLLSQRIKLVTLSWSVTLIFVVSKISHRDENTDQSTPDACPESDARYLPSAGGGTRRKTPELSEANTDPRVVPGLDKLSE